MSHQIFFSKESWPVTVFSTSGKTSISNSSLEFWTGPVYTNRSDSLAFIFHPFCPAAAVHLRAGELSAEELEQLMTIVANPRQYKIPDWFLNRQKDHKDGRFGQVTSSAMETKLRDDLERLKKIRWVSRTADVGARETSRVLATQQLARIWDVRGTAACSAAWRQSSCTGIGVKAAILAEGSNSRFWVAAERMTFM